MTPAVDTPMPDQGRPGLITNMDLTCGATLMAFVTAWLYPEGPAPEPFAWWAVAGNVLVRDGELGDGHGPTPEAAIEHLREQIERRMRADPGQVQIPDDVLYPSLVTVPAPNGDLLFAPVLVSQPRDGAGFTVHLTVYGKHSVTADTLAWAQGKAGATAFVVMREKPSGAPGVLLLPAPPLTRTFTVTGPADTSRRRFSRVESS